ncbi:ABC-2 family transporter protein [Paenibacillus sp. FSL R7-0273]|uniref:ABC transporter permease n=1 Tax=Paenibacillus sp. FSL R7-0273 TaxID=1536772 RepID=UPI0015C2EE20|nr:ABC-2 family transporter protein [Paenibacillus sp. FSL R7-0273]
MMKYLAFSKTRIRLELFYKFNFLSSFFAALVIFFVEYFLWNAIYSGSGKDELAHLTFFSVFSYILFGNILRKLLGDGVDERIGESYRDGSIVLDKIKPVLLPFRYLFDDLGRGLLQAAVISIPLVSVFLFKAGDVISFQQVMLFIVMAGFAYLIFFILNFILGLVSFWTGSIIGIYMLKMACMSILSGLYIPLEFYPEWLLKLTYVFPFRAIYYLPVSAMMKSYSLEEGLLLILQQLAWVTVLLVLCISLQRAAFKKLTVQGG